jgi:hypothetical protein
MHTDSVSAKILIAMAMAMAMGFSVGAEHQS